MWNHSVSCRDLKADRLTVGLEFGRRAAAASSLIHGLHEEDVLGAALQAVNRVVILLNVGHDHPAVHRVTQTWNITHA